MGKELPSGEVVVETTLADNLYRPELEMEWTEFVARLEYYRTGEIKELLGMKGSSFAEFTKKYRAHFGGAGTIRKGKQRYYSREALFNLLKLKLTELETALVSIEEIAVVFDMQKEELETLLKEILPEALVFVDSMNFTIKAEYLDSVRRALVDSGHIPKSGAVRLDTVKKYCGIDVGDALVDLEIPVDDVFLTKYASDAKSAIGSVLLRSFRPTVVKIIEETEEHPDLKLVYKSIQRREIYLGRLAVCSGGCPVEVTKGNIEAYYKIYDLGKRVYRYLYYCSEVDTDEDFIEKLVKIAENGCWAYRLIVESVYPLIISEVTKRIDSFNPEYQDIVQDLALRVDYWLKKYDPTKGAFSTYVVASIHNYLVNNWIRSSGKKRMWETCFADLKLEDPDADAEDYQVYSRSKSALRNSGGDVPSVVATRMAADTVRDRLEVVSGNGVSVTDVNYTKLRFGLLRGRGEYSPTVIARLVGRTDKHVMHRIAKVRETLARDETTRRLAREFSIGIDDGKR